MGNDDLKGLAQREALIIDGSGGTSARATPASGPYSKRNAEKTKHFLDLLEQGHSVEASAVGANIPRRTIYNWRDKHEDFAQALDDAQYAAEGSVFSELRSMATRKDDTRALMWILARLRPDRYGDKQELQVSASQKDGIPEVIAMLEQTAHLVSKEPDSDSASAEHHHRETEPES